MSRRSDAKSGKLQQSRMAPEPEGPEEVYHRFERLNRRGRAGNLKELASGVGKKTLYGAFAVVEVAAIVLGFFLEVPYLDTLAIALPGLLVLLYNGSKDEAEEPDGTEGEPYEPTGERETPLEVFLGRLRRRFGHPGSTGGERR